MVTDNAVNMMGIYTLEDNMPSNPEIILANCKDAVMLSQVLTTFADSDVVRFFLVHGVEEGLIDNSSAMHFIKSKGSWTLAAGDDMVDIRFDDADFNPGGKENTFDIVRGDDSTLSVFVDGAPLNQPGDSFMDDPDALIVGQPEEHLFASDITEDTAEDLMVVNTPVSQSDTVSLHDVVTEDTIDFNTLVVGQGDQQDVVAKLLGVDPTDLAAYQSSMDVDSSMDSLIQLIIDADTTSDF